MNINGHPTLSSSLGSGPTPVIAAIDLGTNSCRLLVARSFPTGLRIIDSFSRIVRLGEGVQKTDMLSTEAMNRSLEALKICHTKIHHNHVNKFRAVTTEACRRAKNGSELVKRVATDLNLNLEIISNAEEARLALSGCAGVLNPDIPYAIAFDIGGGSTEVMWLRLDENTVKTPTIVPEAIDWISLPYGVVTLSEAYGTASLSAYQEIRDTINTELKKFSERNHINRFCEAGQVQMVGTSGTVTTLAAVHLGLQRYDRHIIDGFYMQLSDIHRISSELLSMGYQGRINNPCIGPGRADLVVIGAAILEGICDTWSLPRLRVADRGVREGILLDLVQELQRETEENSKEDT